MIARVAVTLGLNREFDYTIPEHLVDRVRVGSRVTVPFGRRRMDGYVTTLAERSAVPGLKAIHAVEGASPFLDAAMLKLVRWMASYYCAPLEHCIRTVLPGAVRNAGRGFKEQLWIRRAERGDAGSAGTPSARCFGKLSMTRPETPSARCFGKLSMTRPETTEDGSTCHAERSRGSSKRGEGDSEHGLSEQQARVLAVLRENDGGLWLQELLRAARITASPARTLAKRGLVVIEPRERARDPFADATVLPTLPLALSDEQAAALAVMRQSIETLSPSVVLLYGVTGSGKTEVYLQAIAHVVERGGSAVVLVPEIALTPQTVSRFRSRFGDHIAVLHSNLSDGERHDQWHRIAAGEARVVIGARSAVFAPLRNLQLIVVDEEHEPSYKQSEAPRYNARDVAVMRGHLAGCAVVLGSATPALESWHNTRTGKYACVTLKRRADDRSMPVMRVIDMRIEAERHGHPCVFSQDLLNATSARIERGEQTIFFLNRRGYSTAMICHRCGHVSTCEACGIAHTYHRPDESLRCHLCGRRETLPSACPACGDPAFRYTGFGTQRVETAARKCFPHARIARMDADTTQRRDAYEQVLGAFRRGDIDILIGTQMIAKGLHFPNVTLVGVIYADLSLHVADFRAGERTYQLLAQVAGRAGRGDVKGEVLVQTYTPQHAAVQAARSLAYETFSAEELAFRRELSYPPFAHLICLLCKGPDEAAVQRTAGLLAAALEKNPGPPAIISPAVPAPLARINGQYRYQVMLRTRAMRKATAALTEVLAALPPAKGVVVQLDVDALSLM